ncbi:protein N-lysine methyltransferase FAM173A isoform X2 [Carassius auratus]|uniref:Protein N-lysine methyltransferase FAM173A isoform X2 n=1 Tax=Carassius auratus TaxID=7957 RepID=A0A6P6PYD4_CARAU|nr:protein N-lysine methyltransferase FAM173A-like isoform X2 [Carassius auratus]
MRMCCLQECHVFLVQKTHSKCSGMQKSSIMEDSVEVILQHKSCKLSNHAQEKPLVTAASGALLVGAYGLWSLFALPGFRKVPICLKVPYLPSSSTQTQNVLKLLHGRAGCLADLGSGDGRLTDLSKYNNVTVFLAPGVMEVLGRKLEKELPDEARVIACRFPFPDWTPTATEGEGLDQTWAYDIKDIHKLP